MLFTGERGQVKNGSHVEEFFDEVFPMIMISSAVLFLFVLGPLGFEGAQHRQTLRPTVDVFGALCGSFWCFFLVF